MMAESISSQQTYFDNLYSRRILTTLSFDCWDGVSCNLTTQKLPMPLSPHRLFLLDGLGALLTAVMLFFVLARFEDFFGMPIAVLKPLAAAAVVFAVYSLTCHRFLKQNPKPFLLAIATANALYCITTVVLMQRHADRLTAFGFAYFIGEIIIIGFLVFLEYKAATSKPNAAE